MIFKEVIPIIREIPSTTEGRDCEEIFRIGSLVKENGVIIETGTGNGRVTTVLALATMNKNVKIITIDDYSETKRYSADKPVWSLDYAKNIFKKLGIIKNIEIVSNKTINYLKRYKGRIDLIYLDDCHLYKIVKEEIRLSKRIMKDGIIAGHDYNNWCSDGIAVSKAVDEEFKKEELNKYNTVWSVNYKKETK